MKSIKSFAIALCLLSLMSLNSGEEEVATPARLLVEKQILNKYLVENKDIIVHYNIFNVGGRLVLILFMINSLYLSMSLCI